MTDLHDLLSRLKAIEAEEWEDGHDYNAGILHTTQIELDRLRLVEEEVVAFIKDPKRLEMFRKRVAEHTV